MHHHQPSTLNPQPLSTLSSRHLDGKWLFEGELFPSPQLDLFAILLIVGSPLCRAVEQNLAAGVHDGSPPNAIKAPQDHLFALGLEKRCVQAGRYPVACNHRHGDPAVGVVNCPTAEDGASGHAGVGVEGPRLMVGGSGFRQTVPMLETTMRQARKGEWVVTLRDQGRMSETLEFVCHPPPCMRGNRCTRCTGE